jgi:hypothetical protein
MNAPVPIESANTAGVDAGEACQMVVVYEDLAAHERAMEMGGRLTAQFGDEPAFAFSSWNFKDLADPAFAAQSVETAARADVIIISTHGNELPSAVGAWLESCARARIGTEGALALLLAEPFSLSAGSGAVVTRLEHTARRLGMDYLPLLPEPAEQLIKSLQAQASLLASSANETLDLPGSDHWGLNE